MRPRDAAIDAFLSAVGWPGARRRPLAADASFRLYERIEDGDRRAVLMDAPPDREDVRPFLRVARRLAELGLSAPRVLAEDADHGLLLLEDFGDATFSRLLNEGAAAEPLYLLAVDVLIDIHGRPPETGLPRALPRYTDEMFLDEAALLTDWYLPAVLSTDAPEKAKRSYRDVWGALLPLARNVPETLVLRDFHVDNLMRLEGRSGVAACGLLDFQDAVAGPATYDIVSLIEDARRDVDPDVAASVRTRYLSAFPDLDPAAFELSCAILGAQRHCKVIGIFTRLRDRDGKSGYLGHLPRLWRLLEGSMENSALAPLRAWLDEYLPRDRRVVPPVRRAS